MLFSNFVQHGCVLFRDYCFQREDNVLWEEVVVNNKGNVVVMDRLGNSRDISARIDRQMRLMLVHGDIVAENREKLLKVFNSAENAHGQLINVIVLSPASMEGIDLKCVRHVHILEPQWSWAQTEQIIYRAVRRGSHAHLPPAERTVQPHIYIAFNTLQIEPESLLVRTGKEVQAIGYSTDQIIY